MVDLECELLRAGTESWVYVPRDNLGHGPEQTLSGSMKQKTHALLHNQAPPFPFFFGPSHGHIGANHTDTTAMGKSRKPSQRSELRLSHRDALEGGNTYCKPDDLGLVHRSHMKGRRELTGHWLASDLHLSKK